MSKIMQNIAEKNESEVKISALYNKIVISGVLTLIFLSLLIFYIYPEISKVSVIKADLVSKITDFETLDKDGLTYTGFISETKDEHLKKMLEQDGEIFFSNNLKNTSGTGYIQFLQKKAIEVDEKRRSKEVLVRDEKISKILPSYTEGFQVEGNMTDLGFVNYVESLLKTFQLKTNSEIGIEDLVLVEDKNSKKNVNLGSEIFYIPLKLELTGRKSDIVDFLNFVQNVGTVLNVDKMEFYKDDITNRVIMGQNKDKSSDYNIFENKIMDIEKITLEYYIDTSSSSREVGEESTEAFIKFIKDGIEKKDEYSIDLELKFYVKGLPTFMIEKFIEKEIKRYNDMSKKVKDLLSSAKNKSIVNVNSNITEIVATLKTLDLYLSNMDKKVKNLEDKLKKKIALDKLYKETSEMSYDLGNLKKYVNSIKIDGEKK